MLINIFDDYQTARNACVAYQRCGKRHQGLRGVEYRVYFYNGKYRVQIFQTVLTGQCLVPEFKPLK